MATKIAGVAQLVEQLTCNQQVAGSSPIASSRLFQNSFRMETRIVSHGGIPERPKGTDCKSVVSDFGGSNPPPSTIQPPKADSSFESRRPWVAMTGKKLLWRFSK